MSITLLSPSGVFHDIPHGTLMAPLQARPLITPILQRGHRSTEMFGNFSKLTRLVNGRARIQTWLCLASGSTPPGARAFFDVVVTQSGMCSV